MSLARSGRTAALALVMAALLALAAAAGCGSSGSASSASTSPTAAALSATDDTGAAVTLQQPAARIVSLAPANTEIAYAIGAGSKMVAGTNYDDYPAEAKSLPKVGDFQNPNVEKIASFQPDLVLATGGIQDSLRGKLEGLGMKVFVVDPKTYDGTIADIVALGKLSGTEAQAQQVADQMTQAKTAVQAQVGTSSKPTVFLEIYSKPLMTAGSGTFINDMISLAGGTNIGAAAGSGFPSFSTEVLFKDDPAVYIADSGSMSKPGGIAKRPGFGDLTAVKQGHVYVIEDSLIARPGPRLAQGLQELAKMIHPEASSSQ